MSEPMGYQEFVLEAYSFFTADASTKDDRTMTGWKPQPTATFTKQPQHIEQLPTVFDDHDYELAIGGV